MNIILFGGAGFIGTNLVKKLAQNLDNNITVVDKSTSYFFNLLDMNLDNISVIESSFEESTDFDNLVSGNDIVYHLVSTTVPSTSNLCIAQELRSNVVVTVKLLEACVRSQIKKIVFLSSGGTVYGKDVICPIKEDAETNPINSYGLQKISIEKLLYLFWYMYGLDYRIIRLSNPYGPYQRPNGIQGAITTFTYKAIKNETINVYGDGSVIRDFIYIDDAVNAILKIVSKNSNSKLYNLGSGYGKSLNEILDIIRYVLNKNIQVEYQPARKVDVPVNFLDISRYEENFGKLNPISLEDGITNLVNHMSIDKKISYIKAGSNL